LEGAAREVNKKANDAACGRQRRGEYVNGRNGLSPSRRPSFTCSLRMRSSPGTETRDGYFTEDILMSRINTNVSSLIAVNALNKNTESLQTSLTRLSTGVRINSGKDDPSGLIASESLKAEQQDTQTAIGNAQQANNLIGTAEGSLSEVSNLLVSLQGLVGNSANSAGLSQDEKNANQLQVDSILSTINRISNSSSFQGVKLLNGTYDYTTSGVTTTSAFTSVSINSAKVTGGTLSVTVDVIASAQTGE